MTFTLTLDPRELSGQHWQQGFEMCPYQDDATLDAWPPTFGLGPRLPPYVGTDGRLYDGVPVTHDPSTGTYSVELPDQTTLPAGYLARYGTSMPWTYVPAFPHEAVVPFTRFITRPVAPPLNPDYLSRLADIEARLGDLENFSVIQEPDGAVVITRGDTEVDGGGPRTTYDARHIIDGGRP